MAGAVQSIRVAVATEPEGEGVKGLLGGDRSTVAVQEVPVERLRAEFAQLQTALQTVLADLRTVGDFPLKTVTVEVELSAEGGVTLIGTAKAGVKGAVKLTFGA